MKTLLLGVLVMLGACSCPATETGVDSKDLWTAERDAVCAQVPGCDAEFMAQVPVYKESLEHTADVCDGGWGCFCANPGCAGVIVYTNTDDRGYRQSDTLLHEYTHAAFYSIDHDTHDHPPEFLAAMKRARATLTK